MMCNFDPQFVLLVPFFFYLFTCHIPKSHCWYDSIFRHRWQLPERYRALETQRQSIMHELVAMKTAIAKSGREPVSHFIAYQNWCWVEQADKCAKWICDNYHEIIELFLKLSLCWKHFSEIFTRTTFNFASKVTLLEAAGNWFVDWFLIHELEAWNPD